MFAPKRQLAVQGGTGPVELDKVRKGKNGQNQGDNRVELTQFKSKTGQTKDEGATGMQGGELDQLVLVISGQDFPRSNQSGLPELIGCKQH